MTVIHEIMSKAPIHNILTTPRQVEWRNTGDLTMACQNSHSWGIPNVNIPLILHYELLLKTIYTVNITCSGDKHNYCASYEIDNIPSKVFLFHHCTARTIIKSCQSTGLSLWIRIVFLATLLSEKYMKVVTITYTYYLHLGNL